MENEIFYNHPFGSLYLGCFFTDFKFSKSSGKMVQFPFICRKQGHSSLLRQKVINKVVKWYFHQRWKMRFDIKLGVLCRTDFGQYLGVLITRKLYFIITKTKKSGGHLDVTTWPYYGHPSHEYYFWDILCNVMTKAWYLHPSIKVEDDSWLQIIGQQIVIVAESFCF